MNTNKVIAALNNPVRRQIMIWLKDRSNFPASLPEHTNVEGVCIGYIKDKTGLSQSTISLYMDKLKQAGLVDSERHGQWTFYRRNEKGIEKFYKTFASELLAH
jgi:ArsR family transcriptional regulator